MPTQQDRAESRWVPLAVGIAALIAFVVLRFIVPGPGDEPLPIDKWWHDSMLTDRTDLGLAIAWVPGWVAGTLGTIVTGLVLLAIFLLLRRKWDALTIAVAMIVSIAIAAPVAYFVGRIRPKDSLAEQVPTSFPSGHTALAATITIIIALLIRRWWAWLIAVVWIAFVGVESHLPRGALADRRDRRDSPRHGRRPDRVVHHGDDPIAKARAGADRRGRGRRGDGPGAVGGEDRCHRVKTASIPYRAVRL